MSASTLTLSAHHLPAVGEQRFPAGVVAALRHELPTLAESIVKQARPAVEEVRRPGMAPLRFGLEPVVEKVLWQFLDQIADPAVVPKTRYEVFEELGRQAREESRELDALQTAYWVAARVAWQRIAEVGDRARWPSETVSRLAGALFAYIERITTSSLEGHARERESAAGELRILRRRLLEFLLASDGDTSGDVLADLVKKAQWPVPKTVACVAFPPWRSGGPRLEPAVDPDVLLDVERPQPCLLVPEPNAPGRVDSLVRALGDSLFAIGPSVSLSKAALSHRLAVQALTLARRGVIDCERFVRCSDELSTLLLMGNQDMVRSMAERRYGPLAALKSLRRERLRETLLAWLHLGGNARELGDHLHVHPQTVRYRMRQLQDLFGEEMDDPDWKFEMEIVLRAERLEG
ncbi:helix-turn-helix domain-containing protein [Actinomadura nitritigenes]|uniref:PucR family transcriptional regulator n=1 Tax=Actinomadura nitritigenes TaxID=134602 RepID=UPI003D8E2299